MTDQKQEIFSDAIRTLSMVLDFDEGEKVFHAWRVGLISLAMGRVMNHPRPDLLYYAGLLHDIGAVGLEDHVIHHAQKGFTNPEARGHSQRGEAILNPLLPETGMARMVLNHHERFDGKGFPHGKGGEDISVEAGVIHMADILDVTLRNAGREGRHEKGLRVPAVHAGKAVSPHIAQAAVQALAQDPEWFDDLFDPRGLKSRVMAVQAAPREIQAYSSVELLGQLLWLFSRVIDAKSPTIMGHSIRVAWLASRIARALGPEEIGLWDVVWAGLLHDVGVVGVSRSLLEGSGPPDRQRARKMARHAAYTVEIMSNMRSVAHLAYAAGSHHERYDGGGYPHGSAGEGIPLLGRVLAFADMYDRLTSPGIFSGLDHGEAMVRMEAQCGKALDPRLAEAVLPVLDSCGESRIQTPEVLEDFNRLFETDQADTASLVGGQQALLTGSGQGHIRTGARQWAGFCLDTGLAVQRERQSFAALFPQADPGDFLTAVAPDEQGLAREKLAAAQCGQPIHWMFNDAWERPMEALASRQEEKIHLYLRQAKALEHPLKRVSLLYQSFLFSNEPVVFTDAQNRITDANRAFLDLWETSLEELAGRDLSQTARDLSRVAPGQARELEVAGPRGNPLHLLVSSHAILDTAGNCLGHIWHLADMTRRREMERELEQKNRELAELNQLKSDMLAITSHDMKSPLGGIIGYAEMLRDLKDLLEPEEKERYLGSIIDSGRYLVGFINDILDAARIETGSLELFFESVKLNDILAEVQAEQSAASANRGIQILFDPLPNPDPVWADPNRVRQVLANLLSNAVKFSPEGGEVVLDYRQNNAGFHEVTILDQGPGVPEQERERIFNRYYQVTRGGAASKASLGSGLGLYIAKKLAQGHGGDLSVRGRKGPGSAFTLALPSGQEDEPKEFERDA